LTSVISAVYYLNIIKEVFFDKSDYKINPELNNMILYGSIIKNNVSSMEESMSMSNKEVTFKLNNIVLSSSLTITISILTLIILLFIFIPKE